MTVGSLFAGIGGFDLGFERAGFEIRWQVEIDPFCQAVLAQHWPRVKRYGDVRTIGMADTKEQRRRSRRSGRSTGEGSGISDGAQRHGGHDLEPVDVICGGFPCQPHSLAGRRGGASDDRDLWPEFARLICEVKPRWVVAENVPGLLSSDAGRFFGTVLGDLAACGYDAEWDCLPASAFGAPHRRDRVWLVAYPDRGRQLQSEGRERHERRRAGYGGHAVADADGDHRQRWSGVVQMGRIWRAGETPRYDDIAGAQWRVEPDVGRVAHGVSARVDRLRGLGNAIVPQIAEWIARRIRDAEEREARP